MKTNLMADHTCSRRLLVAAILIVQYAAPLAYGQNLPGLLETNLIRLHQTLAERYKAGDTSVPLLRLDCFQEPIRSYSVDKTGKAVSSGSNGLSNWTDWNGAQLTSTNLHLLMDAIRCLPPSKPGMIALHRQIHISAIRDNDYPHLVYDIDDLPNEVHRLFQIIGPPYATMAKSGERPELKAPFASGGNARNAPPQKK